MTDIKKVCLSVNVISIDRKFIKRFIENAEVQFIGAAAIAILTNFTGKGAEWEESGVRSIVKSY